MLKDEEGKTYQKGGCGGFGKGNFSELFRSIEEYEKTLESKRISETTAAWATIVVLTYLPAIILWNKVVAAAKSVYCF